MSSARSISPTAVLSMTGFGSAEDTLSGQRYRIEMRAVNHRFLDLKLRLPREFQGYEAQIRSAVQSRVGRGSVDLKLEKVLSDAPPSQGNSVSVDSTLAKELHEALEALRLHLNLKDQVSLTDILKSGPVLSINDPSTAAISEGDAIRFWEQQLGPFVEKAVLSLLDMRQKEGAALAQVLSQGIAEMAAILSEIRKLRQLSQQELGSRLREKLRRVLEAFPMETTPTQALLETRLAQELAFALDRSDIQEELDRFEGHLAHFTKTLKEGQQLGKKLEFILQELGREINTLGNKAQDLGISQNVVTIKVRLEQLREQVLNLA